MNKKRQSLLFSVLLLIFANFFVWKEVFGLGNNLKVVFFDIGQGDSIFIETDQGHQILIDGGPSQTTILEKLSKQMPFWDRTLDLVISTHSDYDHLTGLISVLKKYKAENIFWNGISQETKTFQQWQVLLGQIIGQELGQKEEAIGQKNVLSKPAVFIANKGVVIKAGKAVLYILYPFKDLIRQGLALDSNDGSVVTKLVFGANSFLFTGDISRKIENALLVRSDFPVSLQSNVLKVAHHGSKTSTQKVFLEIVQPQIAVISCGKKNTYGHPHQEVLSNLTEFGINILRTDLLGDVEIIAGNNGLSITKGL